MNQLHILLSLTLHRGCLIDLVYAPALIKFLLLQLHNLFNKCDIFKKYG